ncbi:MAG: fumarate hydratase C-terminal domain-containing protein [Victivallales bacterium]|nr:fumarate hydratase C-terminal domain-containing protein [Victivallales bacterium]
MEPRRITSPLDETTARNLRSGERVLLDGVIYTARDAAHQRWCEALGTGDEPFFESEGAAVYFAGPTPAKPGAKVGSIGPTTSGRMDAYSPTVIRKAKIRAMIGKGNRSAAVVEAMKECGCVYLAAAGGLGALLAESVIESEIVAYADLGPEAVRRLVVRGFPAVVAIDCEGNNLYETGPMQFRTVK